MSCKRVETVVVVLVLLGCGGEARDIAVAGAAANSMSAQLPARRELQAMPMLPAIRAGLDSVAANPGMLNAAMPRHLTEARDLMAAMRADMIRLGMHSDPAYEALADSIVRGAAGLSAARGEEVQRLAAQRVDQIRRLTSVYEAKTTTVR